MNRSAHAIVLCLVLSPAACRSDTEQTAAAAAKRTAATVPAAIDGPRGQVSYMVGLDMAKRLAPIKDEVDIDTVVIALRAAHAGAPPRLDEAQIAKVRSGFVEHLQRKRQAGQQALAQKNLAEGDRYLADNRKQAGVVTTASGLQYRIERPGRGARPAADGTVRVNYVGRLLDGSEFESTYATDHPAEFPLNQIMPGLREGLMLMSPGAKHRFWVPARLGYGETGVPGQIEPNATLVFDLELLEIAR
ncbi:FKBP-type peptidyl-prolyl cis-trans isomerase family protein [Lysobacter antibioticus]|uniref:FKBP-type peptidyl-prolyl cis-trans isomerase N-terminal domain-containing protein n=1 Tax=Lysobacter antibioticus TaxID=84531 RepID=UPI00071716BA|nr:FKBP-type peptidyl-prolyl cis-trans isomerase [Lysobacter antibioticus]ALN63311.1 FKBP-type peptidyl-prolyl cis-trans isomerase family protein [Lysobacter antibioticus]